MSLTATYDGVLSRVELAADTLGGSATYAVVERSHNELWWDTVRGGEALPVTAGEAELKDAEFFPGAPTFYRITSFDASDVQQAQFTDDITVNLTQLWLVSLRFPMLNQVVRAGNHGDVQLFDPSGVFRVSGRSLPVGTSDKLGGRDHVLELVTHDRAEEDALLLRLRVGRDMYLQVPGSGPLSELLPGSMHILVGEPTKHRLGEVSDANLFRLPITEVAAPGPNVVPTDLTVGTVLNSYGTVGALWSAHPTIRNLWNTIGSPSDLVAI